MKTPAGWECHHLVEQGRTSQFGTEAIPNTANAINLPESLHKLVSTSYSLRPRPGTEGAEMGFSRTRDYVSTLPFAEQRQYSIDTIKAALQNPNLHISADDRAIVEKELKGLENLRLTNRLESNVCVPGNLGKANPEIPDVLNAVQRLQDVHGIRLPRPQSIEPWDGKERVGSFVDIGDGILAQHVGRGAYHLFDVQENLGGNVPPLGQQVTISQTGQAQPVSQIQSPSHGLG